MVCLVGGWGTTYPAPVCDFAEHAGPRWQALHSESVHEYEEDQPGRVAVEQGLDTAKMGDLCNDESAFLPALPSKASRS